MCYHMLAYAISGPSRLLVSVTTCLRTSIKLLKSCVVDTSNVTEAAATVSQLILASAFLQI